MLNILQLIGHTPESIQRRAPHVIVRNVVATPDTDSNGNHCGYVVAATICPPPHGSGNLHKTELRLYPPLGKNSGAWVSCDCESHLYTFEVVLTVHGSSSIVYSNKQIPILRNPTFEPGCCKHVLALMAKATKLEKVKKAVGTKRTTKKTTKKAPTRTRKT